MILSAFINQYNELFKNIFMLGWIIYLSVLIMAIFEIKKYENISVIMLSLPYIILTHFWYGLRFFQGICSKELKSKLR